jgi:predicted DNA-binding ribbon-helix-helix protein
VTIYGLGFLQPIDPEDSEWINKLTENEINFNSAVRVLCNHGLVEADMLSQD